jgi:hypothetical protein
MLGASILGKAMDARMAKMATTIKSSINVNPDLLRMVSSSGIMISNLCARLSYAIANTLSPRRPTIIDKYDKYVIDERH